MTAQVGLFALALAFCAALGTAVASFRQAWTLRPGVVARWCAVTCLAASALAVASLEVALLRHDFSVRFVATNGSVDTPPYYTVTSLWAAHDGSLLLWTLILAACLAVLVLRRLGEPAAGRGLHAWAGGVVATVTAFFLGLALFTGHLFDRVSPVPADGPGPTPLLQDHPAMGIHPPLLYLGLVGLVVPFAYAVGALVTGEAGRPWIRAVEVPLRLAWTALTAGIVLGAWWSYAVLGWGGYWSWDPVENTSLMPWLVATALVHSLMVQRRRGALPVWNLSLAIGAFLLAATGVLMTRSGVVASVHSFADSGVGPILLGFVAALLAAVVALTWAHTARSGSGVSRPAAAGGGRTLTRANALLLNNVVLVAITVTVLLGTLLPVAAEAATGDVVSVGPPYYNRMAVPLALLLLVLMAVGPLLRWREDDPGRVLRALTLPVLLGATAAVAIHVLRPGPVAVAVTVGLAVVVAAGTVQETVANLRRGLGGSRRVLGGRLVHLGVAVLMVGVAVSSGYTHSTERTLQVGDAVSFAGVTARLTSVDRAADRRLMETSAAVELGSGGTGETVVRPALRFFKARQTTVAAPAVVSGLTGDVYVTLLSVDQDGGAATMRLAVNPFVGWIWAGGALMVLGSLAGLGRGRRRKVTPPEVPAVTEQVAS